RPGGGCPPERPARQPAAAPPPAAPERAPEQAWNQAVNANRDLLGNLSLDIQRADLGDKGVFYRVRAKGLRSADEAKGLCDKLAARKVGCIVVR
ncbi:SPOR domain-containing protein, partial [Caenispirillum bisanense]|uniref:SPOR domain-containing protein n=1 Tax=Caenispirillum bisanense TaxID=414052 RepID=UPI0031D9B622